MTRVKAVSLGTVVAPASCNSIGGVSAEDLETPWFYFSPDWLTFLFPSPFLLLSPPLSLSLFLSPYLCLFLSSPFVIFPAGESPSESVTMLS